jgi:hypothetical protein
VGAGWSPGQAVTVAPGPPSPGLWGPRSPWRARRRRSPPQKNPPSRCPRAWGPPGGRRRAPSGCAAGTGPGHHQGSSRPRAPPTFLAVSFFTAPCLTLSSFAWALACAALAFAMATGFGGGARVEKVAQERPTRKGLDLGRTAAKLALARRGGAAAARGAGRAGDGGRAGKGRPVGHLQVLQTKAWRAGLRTRQDLGRASADAAQPHPAPPTAPGADPGPSSPVHGQREPGQLWDSAALLPPPLAGSRRVAASSARRTAAPPSTASTRCSRASPAPPCCDAPRCLWKALGPGGAARHVHCAHYRGALWGCYALAHATSVPGPFAAHPDGVQRLHFTAIAMRRPQTQCLCKRARWYTFCYHGHHPCLGTERPARPARTSRRGVTNHCVTRPPPHDMAHSICLPARRRFVQVTDEHAPAYPPQPRS